ncbi:protein dead ringer isoform X2 [Anabrus simplex]|uniref:protein dead ringer isoform X2 n=1 Tax=Anabrus simplex TaxID=316456 RepID=UPI0034DD2217
MGQNLTKSKLSNNDEEMSDAELQDDDSEDALSRIPVEDVGDPAVLAKLKQQEREEREEIERELKAHAQVQQPHLPSPHSPRDQTATPTVSAASMVPPPSFSLPLPFPFPHPAAAFLPPISAAPPPISAPAPAYSAALQNSISSASSHSSESSSSSQQTWSFEEQFKQVRQLYELSDDPKRKEFLDDLFSYMQKRGTPINRLPIMAKSVLDLYELYNLVIARGGLVDVINKKLWQEIIKGLHLPSSITSAAFTLRTQYMKYLYPYECEKRRLSTPAELQAAIDGNRREGRRSSYGTYNEMVQRSPVPNLPVSHPGQMSPLSLVTNSRPAINGNSGNHHGHPPHHPPHHPAHPPPHSQPLGPGMYSVGMPNLAPSEFEARMVEYVKLLNKELRSNAGTPPNNRQGSNSPPTPSSPQEAALNALEMSRLTLWNLYGGNSAPAPLPPVPMEPQKEALNLDVREREVKREHEEPVGPPPAKRLLGDEDGVKMAQSGTHIKIASRGDGRAGMDNSLVVSMEINGIMYQGVLFAQSTRTRMS